MPDDVILDARPLGTRYRLDEPDGSWWELGWDRPLGTFYAQQYSPVPYDPFTHENLVAWHGARPTEISTVAALSARLPRPIPEDMADELRRDADAHPHIADSPFLDVAQAIDSAATRTSVPDSAAGFRTTLPARPLADALQRLRRDPHLAADDLASFARGLGLDPVLAQAAIDGDAGDLGVEKIAEVCEALRCSPYDIWGPKLGREILDVYGPERWPRHIEPLDNGRELPGEDSFVRRRVEQQAAAIVSIDHPAGQPSVALDVTRFRQTGVLAVDEHGRSVQVNDTLQPADPSTEYHFTFQRLGEPQKIVLPITAGEFASGCPAGYDVAPALADAASDLERRRPGADMLRFTDPVTGTEQWLGRETPFDPWQSWDDPRTYYPGDPSDVLSNGPGALDEQLPFTPAANAELDTIAELDGVSLDF